MKKKTKILVLLSICISIITVTIDYWIRYTNIQRINTNGGVIRKIQREEYEYLGKKGYYGYYYLDKDSNKIFVRHFVSPKANNRVRDSVNFMNKTIMFDKTDPENWEIYPANYGFIYYTTHRWLGYLFISVIIMILINRIFLSKRGN